MKTRDILFLGIMAISGCGQSAPAPQGDCEPAWPVGREAILYSDDPNCTAVMVSVGNDRVPEILAIGTHVVFLGQTPAASPGDDTEARFKILEGYLKDSIGFSPIQHLRPLDR